MKASEIMLVSLLLSPYIYTVYNVLSKFTEPDYFILLSFFSLIALVLSGYSSIILLSLMLVPSLVCFGLFVAGNPFPLIGLAAGYLLAFPIFTVLTSYHEKKIENLILAYLLGLTLNIPILYSSESTSLTSSDIIIDLIIRTPRNIISGRQYTLSQSVNNIFTILTALSCIILFFIMLRKMEPRFPKNIREITPLIISTIITLFLALVTRVLSYGIIIAALSIFLIIVSLSIILRIVK
ncbi:MAG: hypothetical protein LZ172_02790 [Thaumarchaeota archaeon]|nr:hypothetical protein [Candidatus Geocrenenecus arthurdayi]MCL7389881.1 hypothetical protein [Candidatus Geocrenenecus arthurdayi]MCL7396536.1 hypothetical protein [Candidatus Geocrenenecus arthurdayi]MCL7403260.1 hypothetical protein [Candidatus Geocrenenecus arthurdayi]